MPMYTYEHCGTQKDEYRSVSERNKGPKCACGKRMKKVISSYAVVPDVQPYFDENLESYIKSKQHRKQVMREKEVYESYGKGWR